VLSEVKIIHLEMTERCNAACPMCGRVAPDGEGKPYLTAEITLPDLRAWLPPDLVRSLAHVYMCGNYGDAIAARDTIACFAYIREHNEKCSLGMHTNGGARPEGWWAELAKVVGRRGKVVFSIDGLADTNHVYRRHVRWELLQRNFRAFIRAGGRAEWHFLIFRHNEHQVLEAQALAKQEGFERFVKKKSARVSDQPDKGRFEPVDAEGIPVLAPPENPEYRNADLWSSHGLFERYGGQAAWIDSTPILCKAQRESSLYVSARGELWPCCWLGYGSVPGERKELDAFIDRHGGREQISLRHHSVEEILASGLYRAVQDGWAGPVERGRLEKCAKMCSAELDLHGAQFR
jgi:MoaA/NifB/PqqE/SkfB family radical SAM enzyme